VAVVTLIEISENQLGRCKLNGCSTQLTLFSSIFHSLLRIFIFNTPTIVCAVRPDNLTRDKDSRLSPTNTLGAIAVVMVA
jgi:hypothetical protein